MFFADINCGFDDDLLWENILMRVHLVGDIPRSRILPSQESSTHTWWRLLLLLFFWPIKKEKNPPPTPGGDYDNDDNDDGDGESDC